MSEQNPNNPAPQQQTPNTADPGSVPKLRWLPIAATIFVVLLLIVIYVGIHQRVEAESALGEKTERNAIMTVSVIKPTGTTQDEEIMLPASTQAFSDTPVYARTNGYVKRWYFDIGARVKQGQLLADIATPEVDQQLSQAHADLKTAQANLAIAQITADRWQDLLKTDSVSKQETDQAVSDLMARRSALDAAAANVRRLEELQGFERVTAPFTGVITARNIDIGSLINAGNGTPLQEMFHISAIDTMRIYVAVPEIDAGVARDGAKVPITFGEYPGERFEGTIKRNSNAIDAASRTLNVEVDIPNRDGRIKPGSYATVHLRTGNGKPRQSSLTIPANTLLFRAEGLRVAVVRNNQAQLVPLTIGRDFGATVEVTAGLSADDQIIVNPSDSLTSGTRVQLASNGSAR